MTFLRYLIYFPLLIRFYLSNQKDLIIKDLNTEEKAFDINTCKVFIHRIAVDKYFRSLFYFRTQGFITNVFRVFYPKEKYFIIDIYSKIGGGVKLAHPYATIINAESIGENLYISHLVTIGEKNGKRPIIGNNVALHANCCIIGGITIGNNVVVGAGTVVTKDIPDGVTVVAAATRFLQK
ncbi:DapH/DapD/GlmU-related protein [Flavobacterium sp.]|uniref:DapH/DapD/GlmU-related protein n=1 Tax=Flavobacterium sp. TaxID=239 RepID=UPI00260B1E65|nr:DapH/DapD/GlmU-related protein [Flavobacterium sp.]MDG2431245.1 DapH/DapD/GlmU-related protein [Flavobacterium sp.]